MCVCPLSVIIFALWIFIGRPLALSLGSSPQRTARQTLARCPRRPKAIPNRFWDFLVLQHFHAHTSTQLVLRVAAWLYSEELADPSTISWEILLDAAHAAYTNPWEWSFDGLSHMTEASPEPFYLTFVFIEALLLANRYSPIRG